MRALPLWLRLGVPIAMVVWLSIGLIVFLNYYNYHKAFHQLTVARYLVLGKDLRQTVEAGLAVGLSARDNAQLDQVLEQALGRLPNVSFIALTDDAGRIVRSIGAAEDSAAAWQGVVPAEGLGYWQAQDVGSYQIGLPYHNSFNQAVGSVVVGYQRAVVDAATDRTRWLMFRDAALVAVFALLAVLVGVWILTRHFEQGLRAAADAIGEAMGKEPIDPESFKELGPEVASGIPDFVNASRRAFGHLEALGRRVKNT